MPQPDDPAVETIDIEGIKEYLAQTEVIFAVLFGSHARGTADESSDVDIALRFPEEMSEAERFRRRNRIDADLQSYADGFVDVSDIESLPTHVAHAALRDGVRIAGDEREVNAYKQRVDTEYDASASEREQERREFIDRLARGDV
ncbi:MULTISPECIES: type VII toxin-antitoxin system MntA family adenylyltransferase antitoxin [Haloferax]|uniref:Nucleotidyltransferase domain protein n=2 Tax=Haloferax TaxID=2251 RepID=A0A871BKZ7_HALGI|nr:MULTISPECIES: nucleotidyltransferase domain-containing protein [Haloferax]KTG29769.1 DNA polymerase III subunit beta [Haloferax profundi]QOS13414.1 nucleotidyltransferase domain protein [Haloferax gibbonsii]